MKRSLALGIDLGGSKIYTVVTDQHHKVIADAKNMTEAGGSPEDIVQLMKATALQALEKTGLTLDDIRFFGAAVPSPVDPESGDCIRTINLSWDRVSLRGMLKEAFGHEFVLGNDANLGTAAEHFCGAAKGFHSSVGFFVGTGLGGGIILDDKLIIGKNGIAGELGHFSVKAGGRRCGCGKKGCLEAYCSKIAFVKALKKQIFKRGLYSILEKLDRDSVNIKSKYLARAYETGDPVVCGVLDKGFRMLGIAAANICAALDPECIVLGGGVVESLGEAVLPPFESAFKKNIFGIEPQTYCIRLAVLGDSSVAVGATLLARGLVK